jgi:hypothetical protein
VVCEPNGAEAKRVKEWAGGDVASSSSELPVGEKAKVYPEN